MRAEDTVTMARFVWAVVHGVAILGMYGQLREPCAAEERAPDARASHA